MVEQYKCNNKREYIFAIRYLMKKYTVMLDMVEEELPLIFPTLVFYDPNGIPSIDEIAYIGWVDYYEHYMKLNTIEIKSVIRKKKIKRINNVV